MDPNLQTKLIKKYPKIFKQTSLSPQESCMYFGIETGDGWYMLIDKICSQLQWNTDKNEYPQVVFTQVKEKYGALTIYYQSFSPEANTKIGKIKEWIAHKLVKYLGKYIPIAISDCYKEGQIDGCIACAESLSIKICEQCGSTIGTKLIDDGWMYTRCKECRRRKELEDKLNSI